MNELNVTVQTKVGEIAFNLDALKENLSAEMKVYENLVVTEDTVKESKKDLAMLRKASKELNDRKIAVKKEFLAPYTTFENEVKEALAIIDKPIALIDAQIKEFEVKQKLEKKEHLKEVFAAEVGDMAEYMNFDSYFKESWLNATAKDKDVIDEVQIAKMQIQSDLTAIKSLSSEIEVELLEQYKRTHSLAECIQKNTNYLETKRLAEERVRKEQEEKERREREEAERKAKEEAERKAQEVPVTEVNVAFKDIPVNVQEGCETGFLAENDNVPSFNTGFTAVDDTVPFATGDEVAIVISAADKDRVIQFLEFSDIKYEVKE